MSAAPTHTPALPSQQILAPTRGAGGASRLSYRYLRGECPCASCRNEWTGERILDPATIAADLKLEGMEGVGNYAVQFTWSDGHGSGLYTWDHLRQLCANIPT